MFFKRLSRSSRTNSYADDEYDHRPRSEEKFLQDHYPQHHNNSPRQSSLQHNIAPPSPTTGKEGTRDMYPRQHSHVPQEPYSSRGVAMNGGSRQNSAAFETAPPPSSGGKIEAAPDSLMRAFNDAIRPHQDKIENLEAELADLRVWVDQLEQQRAEMYAWIDKRGLRPDVPPSIAKVMDAQPESAAALNAQLDRKITIVNFDLHRLQDDLNDSISSSHFASAMSKFLPDISRLSALPSGARCAFDLILKLGGNLNSHGGVDPATNTPEAQADLAARREFYAKLDTAMVDVVRRRFQDGEDWPVQREIKRIEKTAAYLKNFGIEPYFPGTLDAMRREVEFRHAAPQGGPPPPAGSPPKY
ncbi:hypothetical protein BT63DRAFT_134172 [Microthyrium microscopicum]|uniref:Uncharacterized protein n=1 Tax=Microthyrium microscopicum TaxID=703497 RepID=A0A6A6ULQ4_9PEZI|nr:hypothetical protein BT63DRAFT_134172 [Microthyrium microscopicum]